MNREEIEEVIKNKFWQEYHSWTIWEEFDEPIFCMKWVLTFEVSDFFLDEILPEVLVNILIPVDITDCDNWYCTWVSISWKRLSNNKILWYNQCIQDIKDNAKEKYNITL